MCARFQTVRAWTLINFDERFLGGASWKKNEEKGSALCLRFFCYICQPCQTNLNDARPKFGMVAPEFVRFLRRGIYFRQAGLLSLPESLEGVRLGRSKAS
jgi:hypothetical protein